MSLKSAIASVRTFFTGPPAPVEVRVEIKAPSEAYQVFLGTTELLFDGSGTASHSVLPGVHYLFWTVFGGNGQTYRIKITAPEGAKWDPGSLQIRGDHDIGAHEFTV